MNIYLVWHPEVEPEEDGLLYNAKSAVKAAVQYAKRREPEADCFLHVRCTSRAVVKVSIKVATKKVYTSCGLALGTTP